MKSTSEVIIDMPDSEDQKEAVEDLKAKDLEVEAEEDSKSVADAVLWPPSLLFHHGWPLLNHRGIARTLWDVIVNLATVYIAIIVPYEITFMRTNLANRPTLVLDMILEVFFVLDILVNFRTSYKVEDVLMTDQRNIFIHYVKSWLIVDLIAATPLDLLQLINIQVNDRVHLMKTVRLMRLGRLMKKLEKYCDNSALVLSTLMFSFLLIAHWAACVWYEIGLYDLSTPLWHVGWLAQMAERLDCPYFENRTGGLSESDAYLGAIYFTASCLTTVGFGNISPNTLAEMWFAICLMILGALIYCIVFGNMSAIVNSIFFRHVDHRVYMNELNEVMTLQKFPEELRQLLRNHTNKTWMSSRINDNVLLQDFPENIHIRIHLHLFRNILSRPMFVYCGSVVRKELALHVSVSTHRHGDIFLNKDEVVQALHMVSSGALQTPHRRILGPGSLFGTRLMKERPMSYETLQVVGHCTIHSLSLEALQRVMDLFPQWNAIFYRELSLYLDYDVCPQGLPGQT